MTWQFVGVSLRTLNDEHEAFLGAVSGLLRDIDRTMEELASLSNKEIESPANLSPTWRNYKVQLSNQIAQMRQMLVSLTVDAAERRTIEKRRQNGIAPARVQDGQLR